MNWARLTKAIGLVLSGLALFSLFTWLLFLTEGLAIFPVMFALVVYLVYVWLGEM